MTQLDLFQKKLKELMSDLDIKMFAGWEDDVGFTDGKEELLVHDLYGSLQEDMQVKRSYDADNEVQS